MDALKQQLLRIQQQLAGLSASQKMLTGSLVVIMIMTMFYWARYAGDSEFTPLLDQSMSAEDTSRIKSALSAKGISYEVTGDRILVPADKKFELIADLGYAELLPRDMVDGFADIVIKHDNPFSSQSRNDQIWNHAKEKTLGGIISRWPGVKSATVMIDGTKKLNPSRSIQPTAAVAITLKTGEQPSKKLADAAANLLAGAQAGLAGDAVKVTINGQSIARGNKDGLFGDGDNVILKAKTEAERMYADKILEVLQYIPGAYATVSVDLNTKSMMIDAKEVDPKKKVEMLRKSTSTSEENVGPAGASGEPGLASNTGVTTIEGSSSGTSGGTSTREQNIIENDTDHSVTNTRTTAPAGDAVCVAAAVRVPESYFVSVWKRKNPNSTSQPSDADIQKLIEAYMPEIRSAVRGATNIKDDTAISVAQYIDVSEPITGSEASASSLAALPAGFGFGAKEIAIAVLAVISLFMVSMMVRKSVPPQMVPQLAIAGAEVPQGPSAITVGADLAGEVGEGGMLLTGKEMTDGDIESQQVIEQVGTMVKDNPDVAANLVKRWLNRD